MKKHLLLLAFIIVPISASYRLYADRPTDWIMRGIVRFPPKCPPKTLLRISGSNLTINGPHLLFLTAICYDYNLEKVAVYKKILHVNAEAPTLEDLLNTIVNLQNAETPIVNLQNAESLN